MAPNPLTRIARKLRSNLHNVRSRIDIVSPQLCDDALGRLAPSLQKHRGFQPRKHVLAEPPSSPFIPHLEQLTKQQSSRYQLVDWPQIEAWGPDRYVAEGLLPALDGRGSTEPNRSILVLANTALSAIRPERGRFPRTHFRLLCWANDMASSTTFHAGGPVRMLLWCPEKDATTIVPRTIQYRSKLSILMEMTCHVEEIVSSDESVIGKQKKRDQVTELNSGKRVAKLMEDSGITIPPGRETDLHKQVNEEISRSKSDNAGQGLEFTSIRARSWHEELEDLREVFKDIELPRSKFSSGRRFLKNVPKEIIEDPRFTRFLQLERNLKHVQKRTGLIEGLLQEQAQIDALDLQAHALDSKDPQRTATLAEVQQKKTQLQERLDDLKGQNTRNEFEFFKHDRKAYESNPPLLMWDHRSAEPMKAYKEEFYPAKNLCLLDIQPRHPFPYQLTGEQLMFFRVLTNTLWHTGWDNLTGLDRIAPGAFDAVTSKVPSLTDPTRGGERDLHDLPICRLTPEMAYELTKAWLDWPLRPNLGDLLHRGSLIDDVSVTDSTSMPEPL
ncbi:MAG: hypothetical protein Q9171_002142 [Xanthocarpia ochracea]